MTTLSRREYRLGSKVCLFEIGYRSLLDDCHYVLNPLTDRLERIFSIESGFMEGRPYTRVETSKDSWYAVDGSTVLAKNLGEIGGRADKETPSTIEHEAVAVMAMA